MLLVQDMLGFFLPSSSDDRQIDGCSQIYERVYLPQMCNMNTEAMNRRLITNTGTGPLKIRREGVLTFSKNTALPLQYYRLPRGKAGGEYLRLTQGCYLHYLKIFSKLLLWIF